jgi:dienelactone hydrolase
MNRKLALRLSLSFLGLLAVLASLGVAKAATDQDKAKAECHDKFVPVVQACVRSKVMQSGGRPAQYIAGCRAAIMDQARDCVVKLMAVARAGEVAAQALQGETDLTPPSGRGRVVIVLSGSEGPDDVKDFAAKIAQLGYYTVLLDGKAILAVDREGGTRLHDVIAKAQSSSNALPGKVAVIGFALGGGGALAYAEPDPASVATIIAYYPATSFVDKFGGMKAVVANFKVPLLAFAAAQDTVKNCCLLATIQDMQATAIALGKSMDLVVYPNADHGFIAGPNYRADDAEDAWKRTTDALSQALGDPAAAH